MIDTKTGKHAEYGKSAKEVLNDELKEFEKHLDSKYGVEFFAGKTIVVLDKPKKEETLELSTQEQRMKWQKKKITSEVKDKCVIFETPTCEKGRFDHMTDAMRYAPVEEEKSPWLIFDIDERGCFQFDARFGNTMTKFSADWQRYIRAMDSMLYMCEDNSTLIFGGWLWDFGDGTKEWSQSRMGYDENGVLTSYADKWVKPAVPLKIRFWRS